MKMSNGEMHDKLSILLLKMIHADGPQKEELGKRILPYLNEKIDFDSLVALLYTNSEIWALEASIRNGEELPLDEVGRRALQIRELNRKRIALAGDFKIDHASEEKP